MVVGTCRSCFDLHKGYKLKSRYVIAKLLTVMLTGAPKRRRQLLRYCILLISMFFLRRDFHHQKIQAIFSSVEVLKFACLVFDKYVTNKRTAKIFALLSSSLSNYPVVLFIVLSSYLPSAILTVLLKQFVVTTN